MPADALPVVFIPALLCDEAMYSDVIAGLGSTIEAQVLLSPKPRLEESVADILARAPATFALVGTSYGSNLALEIALAAPDRVSMLCLSGCDPSAPKSDGPDLAGGFEVAPEAVIDMLAGLVVRPEAIDAAVEFKLMAHRIGGAAGAVQAHALSARQEAASRLGTLKMPTLLLWGEDDVLVPAAIGHALADALPHAHFHAISGSGHLPTLEKPVECTAILSKFFQEEPQHTH
ncbi:MAG: alpha/beta fold hydrolase [Janthinobacterium lividum]